MGRKQRSSDVVADGVYIAAAATRLSLKNRILVEVLQGNEGFDVAHFMPIARATLLTLAEEAEAERQRQERLDWLRDALANMAVAPTDHALKTLHAKYVRDASRRNESNFVTRLARAFDERLATLQEAAA